jgi:hypothetical protein
MSLTFAHGRTKLSSSDWLIDVTTGGNLTGATKYFSLQAQNPIGKNLALISDPITFVTGSQITFTINETALTEAEGWTHYVIGVSDSDEPNTFNQIARINIYDMSTGFVDFDLAEGFPLTLTITENAQLTTDQFVDTLPTTNLLYGMRRGLNAKNYIYEYNPFSTATPNDDDVLEAPNGVWLKKEEFSSFVNDIYTLNGCAVNLYTVEDFSQIEIPSYNADGTDSYRVRFYLINDSGYIIQPGTGLTIGAQIGGVERTELFDNKIYYNIKGIVTPSEGSLRKTNTITNQTLDIIDKEYVYSRNEPVLVVKDFINVNTGLYVEVFVRFLSLEFNNLLPDGYLQLYLSYISPKGVFTPVGTFFGEAVIYNQYENRHVLPNIGLTATVSEGAGVVKNFSWYGAETIIASLIGNQADQKLYINIHGVVFADTTEKTTSVLHAIVDTTEKESKISSWSTYNSVVENDGLLITVNYDCDENLRQTVRNDYPDVIAGKTATFNPTTINIYVQRQSDDEIRKFVNFPPAPNAGTQDFIISDWSEGEIVVVEDLPTQAQSFFNPSSNTLTTVNNIGNFTEGTYRVAHTYVWGGNTISDISHAIDEIKNTIKQIDDLATDVPVVKETANNANNIATNLNNINNGLDLDDWTPEEESDGDSLVVVNPTEEMGDPDVGAYPDTTLYRYNANSYIPTYLYFGKLVPNNKDLDTSSIYYPYREGSVSYLKSGFQGNRKILYRIPDTTPNKPPHIKFSPNLLPENGDFTISFYGQLVTLFWKSYFPKSFPNDSSKVKAELQLSAGKFSITNVNNIRDSQNYTKLTNVNQNDFHHVVLTREGLIFKYYVNGVLIDTYTNPGNTQYSSTPSLFFESGDATSKSPDTFVMGGIDTRIWIEPKELSYLNFCYTALTAEEIEDEFAKIETYDVGAFPNSWTKRLDSVKTLNGVWFSATTKKAQLNINFKSGTVPPPTYSEPNNSVTIEEIDQLKVLAFNKEGLIFNPQSATSRIISDAIGNFTLSFWVKFKTIKTYDWVFYWGEQLLLQLLEPNFVSLMVSSIVDDVKTDYYVGAEINPNIFNYIVIKREGDIFKLSVNDGVENQVSAPNVVFNPDAPVGIGGYPPNMLPPTPDTLPSYTPLGQYPSSQIHRYTWQSLNTTTKIWEDEVVTNPIDSNVFTWNIITAQKSFLLTYPIEFDPLALDTSGNFSISLICRYGTTTNPNGVENLYTVFRAFRAGVTDLNLSNNYTKYKLTLTHNGSTSYTVDIWPRAGKFTYIVITKENEYLNLYVDCKKMTPITITGDPTFSLNRLQVGDYNGTGNISYFAITNTALTPAEQALELQKITTT